MLDGRAALYESAFCRFNSDRGFGGLCITGSLHQSGIAQWRCSRLLPGTTVVRFHLPEPRWSSLIGIGGGLKPRDIFGFESRLQYHSHIRVVP